MLALWFVATFRYVSVAMLPGTKVNDMAKMEVVLPFCTCWPAPTKGGSDLFLKRGRAITKSAASRQQPCVLSSGGVYSALRVHTTVEESRIWLCFIDCLERADTGRARTVCRHFEWGYGGEVMFRRFFFSSPEPLG